MVNKSKPLDEKPKIDLSPAVAQITHNARAFVLRLIRQPISPNRPCRQWVAGV